MSPHDADEQFFMYNNNPKQFLLTPYDLIARERNAAGIFYKRF